MSPQTSSYRQVADSLRHRLAGGEWQPGERLPSRAQLAAEYGVKTTVLQKACERLIIEGLLEGRTGSGTYVREPRQRQRMVRSRHRERRGDSPFSGDMAELGQRGSWECDSQAGVPAPPGVAARLGIAAAQPCVRTTYEFLADRKPVQLSTSWEPMAITGGTDVELPELGPHAGRGVVERMAAIGIRVATAVEIPRPERATPQQASLLGIPAGSPILAIERTYYDTNGRAVETADITIPSTIWDVAYEVSVGESSSRP